MSQTIILIDDDKVIRDAWEAAAYPSKKIVITYPSIADFLDNASLFQRSIKIYIDSELGEGRQGEVDALQLFDLGFFDLNLIKAYGFERNDKIPQYIKEVISKAPPF